MRYFSEFFWTHSCDDGTPVPKILKDISSRNVDITICVLFQSGSKPTNRLTDIQEIQNYFELVYKHPWNVSKKFDSIPSRWNKDIMSLS